MVQTPAMNPSLHSAEAIGAGNTPAANSFLLDRQGRGQSRSAGFQAGLDRAEFRRGSVRNSESRALPSGEVVSRLESQRSPHSQAAANVSWGAWIARLAKPVSLATAFCIHHSASRSQPSTLNRPIPLLSFPVNPTKGLGQSPAPAIFYLGSLLRQRPYLVRPMRRLG
jgi:hypothetical protein